MTALVLIKPVGGTHYVAYPNAADAISGVPGVMVLEPESVAIFAELHAHLGGPLLLLEEPVRAGLFGRYQTTAPI